MKSALLPIILIGLLTGLAPTQVTAQVDETDRTLDFRNQLRTLWQKSDRAIADNIEAIPILITKSERDIKVPFIQTVDPNGLSFESTLIMGDFAHAYILFRDFRLEDGEELLVTSIAGLWEEERYASVDNKESGRFMIGPYRGDVGLRIISTDAPDLSIDQIYANPENKVAVDLGFAASYPCHINVNCEEGRTVADEKRSVMRIRMVAEEGVGLCTGTLLNNTLANRKPYVLTAFHCLVPPTGTITPLYDMWWFDFNYESFSCANPQEEPGAHQAQGAIKVAEWEDTDMMLLLIDDEIPQDANVFFAGWNRELDYIPDTTYMIHHPVGDIKKISYDFDTATIHDKIINWDNGGSSPLLSHYKSEFDRSTYQPGSSGASIFDTRGHALGQLHGGPLADELCTIGIGYSGRISVSWEGGDTPETRLRDWLDPLGTAPLEIMGVNQEQNQFVRISGRLVTPDGLAIPGVEVELTGDQVAAFATGIDGGFVFENLNPDASYQINFLKNSNARNGLSATDLVIIRNHVIGRNSITNQFGLLAADVNRDGNISSLDLVQVRNLIIGRQDQFPQSPSWGFNPAILEMNGANMTSGSMEITIVGYKLGDVNYSANPRQ